MPADRYLPSVWRVVEPKDVRYQTPKPSKQITDIIQVAQAIDNVVKAWRTKILQPEDDPVFSRRPRFDEASGTYIPTELYNISNDFQGRTSVDTSSSPLMSIDERRDLENYSQSDTTRLNVIADFHGR